MLGATERCGVLATLLLLPPLVWPTSTINISQNLTESASEITGFPPCDALISAGLGNRILLAATDAYESRIQSWWSANGRLRPWCLVQPHTAQELSVAVMALSDSGRGAGDWHIAVRGGGHSLPGANNIANGVTIDLGMMNHSHYDHDRQLARVGPGAAWKDVYYNLLRHGNVTVSGGRDGGVGVGGLLLGGGMSYYSGRSGLGCNEVVNFEVVLANGSIVDANSNENPALWKALKGGGLNFGIVTNFDIRAIPAVDLAYGQSIITSNHSDEIVDAVVEFTNHPEELADDVLIILYIHDLEIREDMTILAIRANTQGDLNTTSFDRINKIPTLMSSWEHSSLADAAIMSQLPAGLKNTWKTLTFLNSARVLRHAASLYSQLVSSLSAMIGAENFTSHMVLQPFPSYYASIGERKGGNVLGLERISSNAVLWVTYIGIKNGDDASVGIAQAELSAMTSKLEGFAIGEETGVEYVYLNYADAGQDPLGSYGPENVAFMKDVARQYDPDGFWQQRVPGGFKLSRVTAQEP
ncbi:uncharacterized protein CIMG_13298 [Coccidioides immitis RS]|uniref:FAD-binding PCMH-type domain-containing protein n=2 Tax=Coccidioides immitis TaxID=5501 RepID=A0A0E1RV37_COCIM|nr:uncharacterized protein CIMG_13298 [Coccidioides immitis RS]EAS29085.2 hypothetical protein CIMG_13298 [Coccidioides immitis RS]